MGFINFPVRLFYVVTRSKYMMVVTEKTFNNHCQNIFDILSNLCSAHETPHKKYKKYFTTKVMKKLFGKRGRL